MTVQPVMTDGMVLDALMLRVRDGDVRAFEQLVRALEGPGLRLADRTLGDRAAAEDVVQLALSRLWTMAERFEPARGSVGGWFRRMVVNLCIDRQRRMRPLVSIEEAAEVASRAPDPEASAMLADQKARLAAAMARLAPRQRAALAMFHGEGMSMAEIAQVLEVSSKAVEGLLGRARNEVKAMLKASGEME